MLFFFFNDTATTEIYTLSLHDALPISMLEWQTTELLARETHRDQWTVYVRPELVVEIAFSDLQASTRYPGGLALRLARVKRYRDDKRAQDADTMTQVRGVYAAHAARSEEDTTELQSQSNLACRLLLGTKR